MTVDTGTTMVTAPPVQTHKPPHERMADLDWFIGEWSLRSRTRDPQQPDVWHEETLYAVHTAELGGNLIWEHFYGPFQGEPYEAWSLRKYDAAKDRWLQKWADSVPGGPLLNWSGTWDAGRRCYIGYGEAHLNADYTLKGDTGAREIFDNIQPDSFAWRFETTSDGGKTWTTTWTLDYTRVAR